MAIRWDDPKPVFIDAETQSAADLKAVGGRRYAADESTRILSMVVLLDDVVHVWIPSEIFSCPQKIISSDSLRINWPSGHEERPYTITVAPHLPPPVREAADCGRTFVGHNLLNFDRFIWREKIGGKEPVWADTLLLARTAGLPGELDKLATTATGQGKDEAKRLLHKIMHRTEKTEYLDNHVGTLTGVIRYNIADVLLLEKLWQEFSDLPVEADVIEVHDAINERGVGVDLELIAKLTAVSAVSVGKAATEIARLTDGELNANNLRSLPTVHGWLAKQGVRIQRYDADSGGYKATLRKDAVEQAIANPWMMLDSDEVSVEAVKNIPPVVFDVLKLRSAALRITEAKLTRAVERVGADGRLRDLFTYWQAGPGRWSSQGVQVHNLPRPKKGIDVERIIAMHESGEWDNNAEAAYGLLRQVVDGNLTVDDALSALIRPIFVPAKGNLFAIADFAAIECRGVAWLAGQTDLLESLATGKDIYCEFASKLFRRPITKKDDIERQIGKISVLGLGYQMGANKFRLFCGLSGVNLEAMGLTAEQCVETYRGTYRKIAGEVYAGSIEGMTYRKHGLWGRMNAAMMEVVSGRQRQVEAGRCVYSMTGEGTLTCLLPSGRQLCYRNARIEDRPARYLLERGIDRNVATLVYDSPFSEKSLYGGLAAENATQAICRDLLASALVRAEQAGLKAVAHVHDEVVIESSESQAETDLRTLLQVMTDPPSWAVGFPVAAEGFVTPRYFKKAPSGYPELSAKSA